MTVGCLMAAAGVFATGAVLDPHVGFGTLGWVLPIAGIGFGIALVPDDLDPAQRRAARALGHGRVGHQHEP